MIFKCILRSLQVLVISEGILEWEANLDIQPLFDHYKVVPYICAYLSKSGDECTQAMSQAVKDAFEKDLDNYEQMKSVAYAYTNKRECSVKECVYHSLSCQWLRKHSLGLDVSKVICLEKDTEYSLAKNKFRKCHKNWQMYLREI